MDSCFDLVGSHQQGVTSNEVIINWSSKPIKCRWRWPQMKLKSKSDVADWPMSHAKCMTGQMTTGKIQKIMLPRLGNSCSLSLVLHVTLANRQRFGFEFHLTLRSSVDDYFITCDTVLTRSDKVETAVHGCNSWLSVWTLSSRCPVKLST